MNCLLTPRILMEKLWRNLSKNQAFRLSPSLTRIPTTTLMLSSSLTAQTPRRCFSLTSPEKELSLLNQSTVKLLRPTRDRVLASLSVMLRTAKAHSSTLDSKRAKFLSSSSKLLTTRST